MKHILTFLLALLICAAPAVAVNWIPFDETTFPDENFRGYLELNIPSKNALNADKTMIDADAVTGFTTTMGYYKMAKVVTLEGIQYFKNLSDGPVTLTMGDGTSVKALDFTEMVALEHLDLSGLTKIKAIYVKTYGTNTTTRNKRSIKSVNVDGCSSLLRVELRGLPKMTTLSMNDCPALRDIIVDDGQQYNLALNDLSMAGTDNLEMFSLIGSKITSLDLSRCEKLTSLTISTNWELRNVKFGQHPGLKSMSLTASAVRHVDLSGMPNVTSLSLYNNRLEELDTSAQTYLSSINCSNNALTYLDFSQNRSLIYTSVTCSRQTRKVGKVESYIIYHGTPNFRASIKGSPTGGSFDSANSMQFNFTNLTTNGKYTINVPAMNNSAQMDVTLSREEPDPEEHDFFLIGEFNSWSRTDACRLTPAGNGEYRLSLPELYGDFRVVSSEDAALDFGGHPDYATNADDHYNSLTGNAAGAPSALAANDNYVTVRSGNEYPVVNGSELPLTTHTNAKYGFVDRIDTPTVTFKYVTGNNGTLSITGVPTGVGSMSADASQAPAEYFNLQGMPLHSAPSTGLYIERRGDKVRKMIAR